MNECWMLSHPHRCKQHPVSIFLISPSDSHPLGHLYPPIPSHQPSLIRAIRVIRAIRASSFDRIGSVQRVSEKNLLIFFEKRKKKKMMETIERQLFIWRVLEKKKFWNDKVTQSRSNKYRGNEPRRHRRCASAGSTRPRSSPARVSPVSRPCLARVSPRLSPRRFLTYLEPFPVD